MLIDIDPRTMVDFHSPSWLANGDLLYTVHWASRGDSTSAPRSEFEVFSGGRRIPIVSTFVDNNSQPTFTRSGKLLYVLRKENPGIWAVGFDPRRHATTGAPQLVAAGATSLSASDDGSLLFVRGNDTDTPVDLAWVDRSGRLLESTGPALPGIRGTVLSPDGKRVAFSAVHDIHSDLWVRDLARGIDTRVTFTRSASLAPQWLGPDRLSFLALLPGERSQLMVVKSDGSGVPRELAPANAGNREEVHFSSDGKLALRIIDDGGHGRLRVSPVLPGGSLGDPAPFLRVAPEPAVVEARLDPSGRLCAYSTDDPGSPRVFVSRFPSGDGQWQVSGQDARQPRWASGSGALFYVAGSGSSRRSLVEVKIDPTEDPPVGRATRLFDLDPEWSRATSSSSYDVAADGQRFLITREAPETGNGTGRMVIVQNWESEFSKPERH